MSNNWDGFQPLTIFTKHTILDVWEGSEYIYDYSIEDFQKFSVEYLPAQS